MKKKPTLHLQGRRQDSGRVQSGGRSDIAFGSCAAWRLLACEYHTPLRPPRATPRLTHEQHSTYEPALEGSISTVLVFFSRHTFDDKT